MNTNNELLRAAKDAVYQGLADDDGLLEGEPLRARLINLRAAIAAAEQAQPDHKDAVMRERYPLLQDDVAATRMALHKAIRDLTDGPASDDLSNEELVGVLFNAAKLAEQAQPSEPEHVTCNDPFAFRCGERLHLRTSGVDRDDRLAFMCAPVPPLLDPACKQSFRGPPVENYCVVGAELVNGKWQWLRIAPDTKELIGDLLFDHGLERGKWYGAIITSGGAS